jgi:hypothetical protein
MGQVTISIRIRKPWWTHAAFAGAKALVRFGYPLDIDRFSRWLGGHFKITAE